MTRSPARLGAAIEISAKRKGRPEATLSDFVAFEAVIAQGDHKSLRARCLRSGQRLLRANGDSKTLRNRRFLMRHLDHLLLLVGHDSEGGTDLPF